MLCGEMRINSKTLSADGLSAALPDSMVAGRREVRDL